MDHVCFTGDSLCESFRGHTMKANMCTRCMKDVAKHKKENVTPEELAKALESTQKGERVPSLILERNADTGYGKLFLGGFKATINKEFNASENIKGVINTVGNGLFGLFGRKFQTTYEDAIESFGINYLEVEWEDSLVFNIPEDDLASVLRHIEAVRREGGSVLVHCAQGKSRSTTAVVAYMMTKQLSSNRDDVLAFVKERRKMAQPNHHFMEFLRKFESSQLRKTLAQEFEKSS